MTDATERARALLAERFPLADHFWSTATNDVLDVLTANPDLLTDLALEAGGLEQVGWHGEAAEDVGKALFDMLREDVPVYRRKQVQSDD